MFNGISFVCVCVCLCVGKYCSLSTCIATIITIISGTIVLNIVGSVISSFIIGIATHNITVITMYFRTMTYNAHHLMQFYGAVLVFQQA